VATQSLLKQQVGNVGKVLRTFYGVWWQTTNRSKHGRRHNVVTESTCDVVIVGAGPVGLLLAIALTDLGVTVRVLEKASSSKRDARAAIVWPRVSEVLRSVGAIQRFEAAACRLQRAEFHVNGQRSGTMQLGNLACEHPFPLMIEQHETEKLLVQILAERGVEIEWSTTVTEVHTDSTGARVVATHDAQTRHYPCAWVVGCDGARSIIRRSANIPFEGAPRPGLECLQVNANVRWKYPDDRETGYFFVVAGSTMLACPLPTGGYRFVCFNATHEAPRLGEPTLEDLYHSVARACCDEDITLTPVEPRWFNRARFHDRIAETLVRGRIILAGDAAHIWTPIGGHGMNAGMRGAHNLAWKLAAVVHGHAPLSLLDTYSSEQRAAARAVIRGITRMKTEEPSPGWMVSLLGAVFPRALRAVDQVPQIEARLTELDAHHRDSVLSYALTSEGNLRVGDRVPDVTVHSDGREMRSHSLLSLHQWTLFAHHGDHDEEHIASLHRMASRYRAKVHVVAVRGSDPTATRSLGGEGRAVLVRPDDHVAVIARIHDAATMGQYLNQWLTRA
jgi:2-polyprenyl-6-methoxyphenol hydroxylase-like FAD-dependent oxidoreductase